MNFPILPFAAFSLVTIFTPGPNNISSMGFGVQYGYLGTLRYLIGICIGEFVLLIAASFFSSFLSSYIPKVFPILKYVGAAYIVFLGIQVMLSSGITKKRKMTRAGIVQGILLQFLNPKALIYSITVFTVFIHPYDKSFVTALLFSGFLILLIFASVSLYTLGGNVIKVFIKRERVYKAVNIVLGLALIYAAAAIVLSDITLKTSAS